MEIRLRELRKQKKLTQMQLAERAGMPQSTISRIESGATAIELETLRKLARALDVDASELISDDGE